MMPMKTSHIAGLILLLFAVTASPRLSVAGVVMDCEGTIESWVLGGYYKRGDCHCSGGQPVCSGTSSGGASSRGHSGGISTENAIKLQLFQGVLDSMLATPPPRKQFKPLAPIDNTTGQLRSGAADKSRQQQFDTNKTDLLSDLKGMESETTSGDAETIAANARKPFDTASGFKLPVVSGAGSATPFFGDTMPMEYIQLLTDPENDPRVVDLRQAETFLVENIKTDGVKQAAVTQSSGGTDNGKPLIQPPDCLALTGKLDGYIKQRERFLKTVNLAQEQLSTWQNANRNALLTAAKDGLEYFTGQLLEGLTKRGEAAERLQRIYNRNAAKMAEKGIDVAEIEAKIRRLRMLSSAGRASEFRSSLSDWQTFVKDGASALLTQLTSSNEDIKAMLDDPRMQEYFETEAPELNALLDISKIAASNKIFGKWVARKVPIIAGVELSIKQSYNALDWILSFKRVTEANGINGKVLASAGYLQSVINETNLALSDCR